MAHESTNYYVKKMRAAGFKRNEFSVKTRKDRGEWRQTEICLLAKTERCIELTPAMIAQELCVRHYTSNGRITVAVYPTSRCKSNERFEVVRL